MKLTKKDIERFAEEIIDYCIKHDYGDTTLYYNNKRICLSYDYESDKVKVVSEEDDVCPLDYFQYARYRHILSMTFEGGLYDHLNYGDYDDLLDLFGKYGMYFELGNSWNLTACPDMLDDEDIEYTDYTDRIEPDPIMIGTFKIDNAPKEIVPIMKEWYNRSTQTGDKGGCVIGAKFTFKYKGLPYLMFPCSPYQGENSWTPHVDWVKSELEKIGATDIVWHCGRLD